MPPRIKDEEEDVEMSDSEQGQQAAAKHQDKGKKEKKRVVPPSSDSDGEGDEAKKSPAKKKSASPEPAKKKAKLSSPSAPAASSSSSKPSTSASSTSKAAPKPAPKQGEKKDAAASFFAPRSSAAKGKAKEKEEKEEAEEKKRDESPASGEGEEEEEDSEAEEEEEGKAAGKIADIFSRANWGTQSGGKEKESKTAWKEGEPVPYASLTHTFSLISATTKRLEISAYLTKFLVDVIERTPEDLVKVVYLCINRLAPEYTSLELGIGEQLLQKAIGESCGRTLAQVKAEYKKVGDLGQVAQDSRTRQKTLFKAKPLTVRGVFGELEKVAKSSGKDSQTRKVNLIKGLLAKCEGEETKFLIRSLEGKLRIGLAEKTVLVSLAHAAVTAEANARAKESGKAKRSREGFSRDLEEGAEIVKAVFSEIPSYDLVVPALLKDGVKNLKEACSLTPGIPLKPMLAKPTKAITEVLDRFEGKQFTCEYKYDGERAQIHYLEDGSIKVFSRNSEDMTVKYPEFVTQLPKCIKPNTQSFVIDAEAVAWDTEEQRLLEFQKLSTRKRKDVKPEAIKVKVHLFAFDMLYLNGEPLLEKNLRERRALLREHLQPVEGEFAFATSEDASTVEEIQTLLDKSIKDGCEGLMVKMLEGEGSSYEPSRRSIHWLKLKKDYLQGVGDSFDLVVIGGDYGKGKRTNVYGAFHLACYDADSGTYQMVCKIGTGFSDEALKQHYETLQPLELQQKKAYYDVGEIPTNKLPNVFFEPKVVWEVLAADLSLSPIYPAAKGLAGERGISLRFPRFIRIRDDKDAEQSTEPESIADAYRRQAVLAGGGKKGKGAAADDGFW
ncbi:ATP-dependent DNA ligase Cdc17 [Rhodosporidiobolus nylandii]